MVGVLFHPVSAAGYDACIREASPGTLDDPGNVDHRVRTDRIAVHV